MCSGFINTDAKYLEKSWLKCVQCCLIQAQKAFLASGCLHVFQTFIQTVQNLSTEGSQEKTGESSVIGTTALTDSDQAITEHPTGKRQSSYQSKDSALPEEAVGASTQEEKVSKQCLSVLTTDLRCEDTYFTNRFEQAEVEEQKERHNIIIIDQITQAERYSWSTEILKEVNTFAPKVQVKYAYSLAKGGVALHTYNPEDKQILLQSLAGRAFKGAKISDLSEKEDIVFLKNIPTYVDTSVISTALQDYKIRAIKVERNQHRRTGRPQPVVKVFCQASEAQKLLRYTSLSVGNVVCDVEKKRANVLRCYNCQQFGHIARACVNQKRCVNCSGFHTSDSYCTRQPKCTNCGGLHRSSYRLCPALQERHALLASQFKELSYVKKPARNVHSSEKVEASAGTGNLGREGKHYFERLSPSSDQVQSEQGRRRSSDFCA